MKQTFHELWNTRYELFTQNKKLLRNTLNLNLDSAKENFELNGIKQYQSYINTQHKGILNTCYKTCSNIRTLDIVKSHMDKYLKKFGLKVPFKLSSKESLKYKDLRINQYLSRRLKRIRGLRRSFSHVRILNYKNSFKLNWFLITHLDFLLYIEGKAFTNWVQQQVSHAQIDLAEFKEKDVSTMLGTSWYPKDIISNFQYWDNFYTALQTKPYLWLSALNSWNPNYYEMEGSKFFNSLKKLQQYIKKDTTHVPLQNVWIESPKGKYRLICVPNFAYRWLCRIWNDALSVWVERRISEHYHGFIYNRGCLSWWKNFIINRYDDYPYIYEFDMASFFPNVNKKEAYEALLYFQVPPNYATHLINLVSGEIEESLSFPDSSCYYEEILNKEYRKTNRNLPMGNALCPLISTLVLYKHFAELGFNLTPDLIVTGYADDNMLLLTEEGYSQLTLKLGNLSLSEYLSHPFKGIIIEPDKSRWVKKAGIWETPLKNLGLELEKGVLRGYTRGTDDRKPSRLVFNKTKGPFTLNLSTLRSNTSRFDKYFGFIQSRLYLGSWNLEIEQNFNLMDKLASDSVGLTYSEILKNWTIMNDYNLNLRNFSSYLNAKFLRMLVFQPKEKIPHQVKITLEGPLVPKWKDGNDELFFRKYKNLAEAIQQLPMKERYESQVKIWESHDNETA